jgi:hypothetical protein
LGQERGRGDIAGHLARAPNLRAFVVEEKERPVTAYGSAEIAAELVPAQRRAGQARAVGKETVGVELVIAEEVKQGPVKLIGSAPGGHVEHAADRAAELGRHGVARSLEFFDRLDAHGVDERAAAGRVPGGVDFAERHVHAVEQQAVAEGGGAVELNAAATTRAGAGVGEHPRLQADQLLEVATVERQSLDHGSRHGDTEIGGGGVHNGCGGNHLDGLGDLAELQP